ncbi:MAG: radical SAM protein [Sphaerochaetaceae bacterium]
MCHPIDEHELSTLLSSANRDFLATLAQRYHLSYQHMRFLIELAVDLQNWQAGLLSSWWSEEEVLKLQGKPRLKALIANLNEKILHLKRSPTSYNDFTFDYEPTVKSTLIQNTSSEQLLGRCPCPVEGELTRCCNLLTLDAVKQCGFGCSYCSIQSFYQQHEILFADDLSHRLQNLELPEGTWHIGTGQSSDSLMWGNSHHLLDSLVEFAFKHPQVVIELKTKSARTDWINAPVFAPNMVATWSVNAQSITKYEEHGTPSLENRLLAAQKATDAGIPVGFHVHPMVHIEDWQKEYGSLIDTLVNRFDPASVVMVSLGTLTFSKEALKQLRLRDKPSRILQMELTSCAGKFSYPMALKEELFSWAYQRFPASWKQADGPFFYLCMEPPQLWEPVLGRSYENNAAFELDMKHSYYRSLGIQL